MNNTRQIILLFIIVFLGELACAFLGFKVGRNVGRAEYSYNKELK